jgi:hypothetical protein
MCIHNNIIINKQKKSNKMGKDLLPTISIEGYMVEKNINSEIITRIINRLNDEGFFCDEQSLITKSLRREINILISEFESEFAEAESMISEYMDFN